MYTAAGPTAVPRAYKCPLSPLVHVCVCFVPSPSSSPYNRTAATTLCRPHSEAAMAQRRDQREKRRTINYRELFFTPDKKLFGCDKLRLELGDFFFPRRDKNKSKKS